MKMHTLHDLFIHELQDLYSAENQILEAMPKIIKAATNEKLIRAFEKHMQETKEQVRRLEEISDDLEIEIKGDKCQGMEGLLKEGEKLLKADIEKDVLDAALIVAAQKVEHYEIAGYGTAVVYGNLMKHRTAVKLLKLTLNEEEVADKELSNLAMNKGINENALNE